MVTVERYVRMRIADGYYWAQNKMSLDIAVVEARDGDFHIPGAAGPCNQRDFFYEWFFGPGPLPKPENARAFREMWAPGEKR